jgi:hypothetical protein
LQNTFRKGDFCGPSRTRPVPAPAYYWTGALLPRADGLVPRKPDVLDALCCLCPIEIRVHNKCSNHFTARRQEQKLHAATRRSRCDAAASGGGVSRLVATASSLGSSDSDSEVASDWDRYSWRPEPAARLAAASASPSPGLLTPRDTLASLSTTGSLGSQLRCGGVFFQILNNPLQDCKAVVQVARSSTAACNICHPCMRALALPPLWPQAASRLAVWSGRPAARRSRQVRSRLMRCAGQRCSRSSTRPARSRALRWAVPAVPAVHLDPRPGARAAGGARVQGQPAAAAVQGVGDHLYQPVHGDKVPWQVGSGTAYRSGPATPMLRLGSTAALHRVSPSPGVHMLRPPALAGSSPRPGSRGCY